jgi:hypothetical protein
MANRTSGKGTAGGQAKDRGFPPSRVQRLGEGEGVLGDHCLRRALIVPVVVVIVAATAGFAPAKNADPDRIFTRVGGALVLRGMIACETSDWTVHTDVDDRTRARGVQAQRRRIVNVTKPCPPRDETGVVPDTPDVVDGLVTVVVYKDSKARREGMKNTTDNATLRYTYGKNTLIQLQAFAPQSPGRVPLDAAFVAAMADLKARRVSEQKPPAT